MKASSSPTSELCPLPLQHLLPFNLPICSGETSRAPACSREGSNSLLRELIKTEHPKKPPGRGRGKCFRVSPSWLDTRPMPTLRTSLGTLLETCWLYIILQITVLNQRTPPEFQLGKGPGFLQDIWSTFCTFSTDGSLRTKLSLGVSSERNK